MRIAFIATSQVPSRTANSIQVMKVCDSFSALGHKVRLFLPGPKPVISWEALQQHYGISSVFLVSWLNSVRLLRRYDFALQAILSAGRWRANFYYIWTLQAAALASTLGRPTILEMHDQPPARFGPTLFKRYLRGSGALRLLPITKSLQIWLRREYQNEKLDAISLVSPMGVNLEDYASVPDVPTLRKELNLREGFTSGYTGHLYSGRGMELLYELAKRNPRVNFVWIGGEPEAVRVWRRRSDQENIRNLQILGFVEQSRIPSYQMACDLLLMPYERSISVSSGGDTALFASPMKAFEYLASGKAIITSDLPVLREVLNEENAVLLPPDDIESWDLTIKKLFADEERRESLGKRARQDAAGYSWKERARRVLEGLPG
jgi:glycosyltransferase involved in cell wall biosynthesis